MSGRVEKIHVQPGQTVKVGAPLISFADAGDGGAVSPAVLDGARRARLTRPS